ncbi:MAG: DUF4388 domain-containing protein [Acidobacteriota bacterium]
MKTEFETAGDIRDVDLLAAFVAFWRQRTTGVVSFSRPGASGSFSLVDGEVVSVSSIEPRFESAAILVRASKLDAAALERLAIPEGSDASLAALQAGILTRREWRWGEKIRAIEILADLLSWSEGKYYFDADARPAAGEFTVAVPRLLLELFLRSRDRHFVDHQLGATDAPLVRSEDFEHEFATFGLTADAESVVRLIDGQSTAAEIARSAPADEFAVHKLLAALTTLGLVRAERIPGEEAAGESREAAGAAIAAEDLESTRRVPPEELLATAAAAPAAEAEADWPPAESVAGLDDSNDRATRRNELWDPVVPPDSSSSSPLDTYPLPDLREGRSDRDDFSGGPSGPSGFDPLPPGDEPPEPPRRGSGTIIGWFFAGLVVAVAALLFWRSRSVSEQGPAAAPAATPSATSSPSPALTPFSAAAALAPTAPARVSPSAPAPRGTPARGLDRSASTPTASAAARAPATAAPLPTRTAPRAPSTRPTATGAAAAPAATRTVRPAAPHAAPTPRAAAVPTGSSAAAGASSGTWASRAARDRRRLDGERSTRYAIQLELACEVPSLVEAWKHDRPAGSMWLLKTSHRGRDCFKVLWGRYPSLEAAKRAKGRIPAFFTTSANHPAIVSVR